MASVTGTNDPLRSFTFDTYEEALEFVKKHNGEDQLAIIISQTNTADGSQSFFVNFETK